MKSADAEQVDSYALEAFEPLCKNPHDRSLQLVGEWLFNDPASPWSKFPWKRSVYPNPVESDLIKVPGFRRLLSRELDNREIAGSFQWRAPNTVVYDMQALGSGSMGIEWQAGERPVEGSKIEARTCDWIAWLLSNGKQIPFFNPFAPVEKRDEAIQNAKKLLNRTE